MDQFEDQFLADNPETLGLNFEDEAKFFDPEAAQEADFLHPAPVEESIYTDDPVLVKDATKFDHISYMEILRRGLRVMDATAIAMCRENNLPIVIFNLNQHGNIRRVVMGERVGSLVNEG